MQFFQIVQNLLDQDHHSQQFYQNYYLERVLLIISGFDEVPRQIYPLQEQFYHQIDPNSRMMDYDQICLSDLVELMQYVCANAGYSRFIDQDMLVDYRSYFDICQLIFQQLSIKIIKIQQNKSTNPGQKLQQLINLLSRQIQMDDFDISGEQIVNGNAEHIHRFLEILYEYSKIFMENKRPANVVKSARSENDRHRNQDMPASISARGPRRAEDINRNQASEQPQEENQEPSQPEPQNSYLMKQKPKKKKPKYSSNAKRARSQQEQRKNLHIGVVNAVMEEKTRMLRAATRDNRKSRLQSVKLAKDAYKIFLTRYAKENNATNKRENYLKQKSTVKPLRQELPQKDFENINNFFESFTHKFRDKKAAYLRRVKKLIHQQQIDRYNFQNRAQRELKEKLNKKLEQSIQRENHQHKVRSDLLKENARALDTNIINMKKQMRARDSQKKKELKQSKVQQLKKIENILREQNDKMLMNLEEGGRMEQLIMEMYKRF